MVLLADLTKETDVQIPPPHLIRSVVAKKMRELDILNGLLKLSERVAKRDGTPAGAQPTTTETTTHAGR